MKKVLLILLITFCCYSAFSQIAYPKVGSPIQEFSLPKVSNFRIQNISKKSLLGKYYILDFFSLGCVSCFASFNHTNILAKKFRSSLDIFLVGMETDGVKQTYQNYVEAYNLTLPFGFSSSLFEYLHVSSVPHLIWVNTKGIIVAITSEESLTEHNLEKFVNGETFQFMDYSYDARLRRSKSFNRMKMAFNKGNGASDTGFLVRSILAPWRPEQSYDIEGSFEDGMSYGVELAGKRGYQSWCLNLNQLYRLALTGSVGWNPSTSDDTLQDILVDPILLTRDSLKFRYSNRDQGENLFNYSLIVETKIANTERMKHIMLSELENYFGYKASIERRSIPYLAMVVDKRTVDSLKTKGASPNYSGTFSHIKISNQPIARLALLLNSSFGTQKPIFDGGNSKDPVDIDVNLIRTDFAKAKEKLDSLGIHLVPRDTFLKVIVIRD